MTLLNQLRKKRKAELVKIAKDLGIKGTTHSNRFDIAKKIFEKQKIEQAYQEAEQAEQAEAPEKSERKPEFEALISEPSSEVPVIEPEMPQEPKNGRGGYREGAGRTPGLTDEKARAQRVLRNEVPDPAIDFAVECLFGLFGLTLQGKPKQIELTTKMISLPATNLLSYYLPNLHVSPVLKAWIDLAIGVKDVVSCRLKAARSQVVEQKPESKDNANGSRD